MTSPADSIGWLGTHYLVSDKLTGPYRLLTDEPLVADARGTYYAGKLVRDNRGALSFIAWQQWDEAGNFRGALSDAVPVHVLSDGRLRVNSQELWTAQIS